MRILGIDPGTTVSGYALYDGAALASGVLDNSMLIELLHTFEDVDILAIEMINGMGMKVGASVFETCVWVGRFCENWRLEKGKPARLIKRNAVKMRLCGTNNANDSAIRRAVISRLGEPGTRKEKGPTFGVTSHAWQALAVAIVASENIC